MHFDMDDSNPLIAESDVFDDMYRKNTAYLRNALIELRFGSSLSAGRLSTCSSFTGHCVG